MRWCLNLRLQENLKLGACLGLERNEALLDPVHVLVEDVDPDGQFIHFVFDDIDAIGRRGSHDDDGSIVMSRSQEIVTSHASPNATGPIQSRGADKLE